MGKQPERWWNAVVEVTVPFDTAEEAREAFTDDDTIDRLFDIFEQPATSAAEVGNRNLVKCDVHSTTCRFSTPSMS